MNCKHCGRPDVPDGSAWCCWCGAKLVKTRRKAAELKIPKAQQLPSGSWFIRLRLGGKSIPITENTERACIEKARAVKANLLDAKKTSASSRSLGSLLDDYIEKNEGALSPATLRGYDIIRRNRFQGYMDKPVGKIDWQAMIRDETALGLSPKTISNGWAAVSAALHAAKLPVPDINLPAPIKASRPFFDDEEITRFVQAVHGTTVEIPALLALHSLRRSELCALTWDDIDLEKLEINVSGALVPDKDNNMVLRDQNKTYKSRRKIPIMIPELVTALEAVPNKTGPVITCTPNNIYVRINSICKRHDLPLVGVHGLRHSFASLGYHLKIEQEIICLWGGWEDSKVVREIYTHLYQKDIENRQKEMHTFFGMPTSGKNAQETA